MLIIDEITLLSRKLVDERRSEDARRVISTYIESTRKWGETFPTETSILLAPRKIYQQYIQQRERWLRELTYLFYTRI